MTGQQMFDKAMTLLGYTGSHNEISGKDELLTRGLAFINQIYSDLHYASAITDITDFVLLSNINDEIVLPTRVLYDVMPYGVAMFLALAEGDGDNQQIFSALYNQKRGSVKAPSTSIVDAMPRMWY